MFRPASSSVLRAAQSSLAPARTIVSRRFISTAPPHLRSRSWKSSAARWGIAIAGLYYYNTSPVFAEQPSNNLLNPNVDSLQEDNDHSTLETLTSHRQKQRKTNTSILESALETTSEQNASQTSIPMSTDQQNPTATSSPADLEEEAAGQGAFNEETGEINWDCPCLGGMAHGPCGPEFREAFSCFVFSKEEPKGMDCIEKFKGMQDCFQQHPEIYKGELEDDEEIDDETKAQLQREIAERSNAAESKESQGGLGEAAQRKVSDDSSPSLEKPPISSSTPSTSEEPQPETKVQASSEPHPGMSEEHEINQDQESSILRKPNPSTVNPKKFDEDLDMVPKAWHDAREPEASEKKTEH